MLRLVQMPTRPLKKSLGHIQRALERWFAQKLAAQATQALSRQGQMLRTRVWMALNLLSTSIYRFLFVARLMSMKRNFTFDSRTGNETDALQFISADPRKVPCRLPDRTTV
jgi:hypothetical protein